MTSSQEAECSQKIDSCVDTGKHEFELLSFFVFTSPDPSPSNSAHVLDEVVPWPDQSRRHSLAAVPCASTCLLRF